MSGCRRVPEPPARIMPFHGVELMGDGVLPVGRSLLACCSGAAGCEAGAGPGKHVCLGRVCSAVVGRRGGGESQPACGGLAVSGGIRGSDFGAISPMPRGRLGRSNIGRC